MCLNVSRRHELGQHPSMLLEVIGEGLTHSEVAPMSLRLVYELEWSVMDLDIRKYYPTIKSIADTIPSNYQ